MSVRVVLIRELQSLDIPQVKLFTDKWIGNNYYSIPEIENNLSQSQLGDQSCSFIALKEDEIVGVRLTLAPGKWIGTSQRGLTPQKWGAPLDKAAYFKSLFIAENFQGRGLGKELSSKSIEKLRQMGAKAIICHSWLESPHNSSQRYLAKMGFSEVASHPLYWKPIDYLCVRCSPKRCECTAIEMIKYI